MARIGKIDGGVGGFSNYTHFAKQFRRRVDHPPGAHPRIR
jgi:hypothetical protein